MTHGSLFSGIGGFDLAAEKADIENIFQVEINEFCRCVLKKNFPNAKIYNDIKIFNQEEAKKYRGKIDIVSGGFPCQPFSVSGKRKGTEDDRYLWNEMLQAIIIIKPKWCIIENVPGLLTIESGLVFKKCIADLENEGYETETYIIPALSKDLLHTRNRIWIIANSTSERLERKCGEKPQFPEYSEFDRRTWIEVATELCGVDDGIPAELDGFKFSKAKHRNERIKALGNAIVPGIAYEIFQAIIYSENNISL